MDRGTLLKYLPDAGPSEYRRVLEARRARRARAAPGAGAHWPGAKFWSPPTGPCARKAIRIFDRTFAITYALEAVAIFVAVMGVGGALLALVIDRRREFGLLRFLGASQRPAAPHHSFRSGLAGIAGQHRRGDPGLFSFAAADFRDQQAILRLDHPIPLAGHGVAQRACRWSMWQRCSRESTRRAWPRAGAHRGDS